MLSLFIENIEALIETEVAFIDLEISKLSKNQKCDLKVLEAKKEAYLSILNEVQRVLSSTSIDSKKEIQINEIIEDNSPYYYLYFSIENGNNTEFYLKSDTLVTQSNISEFNKKISSMRKTSGVSYGASRVYEVVEVDFIYENGILEKVDKW